jgi:hypothetical protein
MADLGKNKDRILQGRNGGGIYSIFDIAVERTSFPFHRRSHKGGIGGLDKLACVFRGAFYVEGVSVWTLQIFKPYPPTSV